MSTFNLDAYGVQEMNRQEMVETNGGWKLLIWWLVIGELASGTTIEDFKKGFNEVRHSW